MPHGVYLFGDGRTEEFSCALAPLGWRYRSGRADVVCDLSFRMLRFAVPGGPEVVAGRLAEGEPVLWWPAALWTSDPGDGAEQVVEADVVVCDSVGSWVALVRAVAPVGLEPTAGTLRVRPADREQVESWRVRRLGGQLAEGVAHVEEWEVTAPDRPVRRLWVVGDVVLWVTGLLTDEAAELTQLSGEPSWHS